MSFIYKYWFFQFDFPNKNKKPYKSSGSNMVKNEILRTYLPENFEIIPLSKIASFLSGYSFSKSDYVKEGRYKLITIKNVQENGINLNVDNYINNTPKGMQEYSNLKPHDIELSFTGTVGRSGTNYSKGRLLNQRVALVKPRDPTLNSYIYWMLKSEWIMKKLKNKTNSSSQSNLSTTEAEELLIPVKNEIAIKFANLTKPIIKNIVKNLSENQRLTKLRDFLTILLINGQAELDD
ncbi:type I restriction/modification specificity protein [Mycoplasmopsis canis UFG1]|uniref:restriction endonuclease subunit S n=1 Tax=Mycoplasmopsis canis TaxID=29555 RepID=UPI00025B013C|nr:restriction endonuclease subunit S [Mycoplasmopsis canis]EIE41656.1 type I restriction/modification specificity protein [Mycoplasmopsis canis UFG1]